MSSPNEDFVREVRQFGFSEDADHMLPWLTDWRGRFRGRAIGLASPESTADVAALVCLCARYGVPIVPQGGNSSMSGGATPDASGTAIILSLRRMNAIRSIDSDTREAVCEAGVVLQTLHEAARASGLRFPLTLGGKGSATIGGLEAVMADGSIIGTLDPLTKDNRGFDLKQLLIGSEGTLGIVTAATLRLVPAIADRQVAWIGLASIAQARELLLHCEAAMGQQLEGFEVLPLHSLDAVLGYLPAARSPLTGAHAWHALVEVVSDGEAKPDLESVLASAMDKGLLEDAAIASSEAQAEAFWTLRESISPSERAIGPAMQHDISVPVAKMAAFVETVTPEVEQRFPGTKAIAFGHLGDGNVHFHVLAPAGSVRGEWEEIQGKTISAFVHDRVTDWGGSISAEHGIGQLKTDELARLANPAELAVMRAVKTALDPLGLLNPGKLLPLAKNSPTA
ncbi:MAG: hydroxyacid dehydrogenase [Citromicrobium sp.]|nr:MAG: hydroxyacid dehydrogenase [Citromicrobium sp.]